MNKRKIHENLYQIEYDVQFRNPNILKTLFPIETNHKRYEQAIRDSRGMYMRNYKKAKWSIERAHETFQEELGEGKIRIIPPTELYEAMKVRNVNFSHNNLVFNPDSSSTKVRLIHDYTREVKKTTLSLEILSAENGLGSLAEAAFSLRLHPYVRSLDISKCYTNVRVTGNFRWVSLNIYFNDAPKRNICRPYNNHARNFVVW